VLANRRSILIAYMLLQLMNDKNIFKRFYDENDNEKRKSDSKISFFSFYLAYLRRYSRFKFCNLNFPLKNKTSLCRPIRRHLHQIFCTQIYIIHWLRPSRLAQWPPLSIKTLVYRCFSLCCITD